MASCIRCTRTLYLHLIQYLSKESITAATYHVITRLNSEKNNKKTRNIRNVEIVFVLTADKTPQKMKLVAS